MLDKVGGQVQAGLRPGRRSRACGTDAREPSVNLPSVGRDAVRPAVTLISCILLALAGSVAVKAALSKEIARERAYDLVQAAAGGFSDTAFERYVAESSPGVVKISLSHDPDGPMRLWARPPGWARLDITTPPTLALGHLSMADAERINAVMPDSASTNPPAAPFVLKANSLQRTQAVDCLTTAIYYEAALEPREGQEAVAQVVLNRMRHAGYPKSVCGVVFQGSDRPGCQFSFACDGSMARPPAAWAWRNAKDVAEHALDGYVMKSVGTATHYHTAWIMAAWTPTLLKVGRIGAHLFFRPTGPDGQPGAFRLAYAGDEGRASKVSLIGKPVVPALLMASDPGSSVAPASAVVGGRTIVMPADTFYIGRVHGLITITGNLQAGGVAPMHGMIAMRAAAMRAARRAADLEAQADAKAAADTPSGAASKSKNRDAATTLAPDATG